MTIFSVYWIKDNLEIRLPFIHKSQIIAVYLCDLTNHMTVFSLWFDGGMGSEHLLWIDLIIDYLEEN